MEDTPGLPHFRLPLDAAAFLRDYWQQRPLFMPQSASGLAVPDPDTLAGLAMDDAVESRIITGAGAGPWQVHQGPFDEAFYPQLGDSHWTLLVQSVDHFLTEVSLLLDDFAFLPNWRHEDIMISYAAEGGSVGAHFDRYDVFLIQASGRRRWQLGDFCDESSPRLPHDQLKLLSSMPVTCEHIAEPGDVLYLPPGLAHHGVALDSDCVTWSVGFRAPDYQALLADISAECLADADSELFGDAGRSPCQDPGVLSSDDRQQLIQGAMELLRPESIESAVYRYLSTPRQEGLEFAVDEAHIRQHRQHIYMVRHGSVRLLLQGRIAWINGESRQITEQQTPLVRLLARQRSYSKADLDAVLCPAGRELLHEWIEQGYFALLE